MEGSVVQILMWAVLFPPSSFFFFSELLRDGLENKNVQAIKVISNFV